MGWVFLNRSVFGPIGFYICNIEMNKSSWLRGIIYFNNHLRRPALYYLIYSTLCSQWVKLFFNVKLSLKRKKVRDNVRKLPITQVPVPRWSLNEWASSGKGRQGRARAGLMAHVKIALSDETKRQHYAASANTSRTLSFLLFLNGKALLMLVNLYVTHISYNPRDIGTKRY